MHNPTSFTGLAILFAIGLATGPTALAQPAATCDAFDGNAAGVCRAAIAQACNTLSTSQACRSLADTFESAAGVPPPWLDVEPPSLACTNPVHGGIVDESPGTLIDFQGTASDPSGLIEVLVNGSPVVVDASGNFETPLPGAWGMNFVTLAATDGVGNATTQTCAFLLSDTWVPDGETLSSGISFRAREPVFDDQNRLDPLDSFDDIGYVIINSDGLKNHLQTDIAAANPLRPADCDFEDFFGFCVLSAEVTYLDNDLAGPNLFDLTLVDGGVRSFLEIRNLRIKVRIRGRVAYIPYDIDGWVKFDHVSTSLVSNVVVTAGNTQVAVRPASVSSSSGGISTDFTGLDGAILNIVVDLFNGTIRGLVEDTVEAFVGDNLNSIFDDIFDGLDVHNLTSLFSVPLLDQATELDIGFGTSFSTMNVTDQRMLTSLGTQFSSIPGHERPTLGAPIPPGTRLLDPSVAGTLAVAVHDGLFNQVLHSLWRAGYFDVGLVGGDLGGLVPPGVVLEFETLLPPAARLRADGRLEIAIGAAEGQLEYPGVLPEAVGVSTAVRGSCLPTLLAAEIRLEQCVVDELGLSFGTAAIDPVTQASLELFYSGILNQILLTTADDFLPTFPIPGFELPPALSVYGLPGGDEMGLKSPQMSIGGDHVVLDGQFGLN